ncbi:Uncharacterized protein OBRU01_00557 [Operophtera brumata]|uniref:Uncharacterized protein n=1 Tax=Operophtera brumata TaxID=104452 RepID=A0A0L7LRT5_OPEBR|nr:Uncharacterized protein OBRU01_00557 [Operophtera brumata]
MQVETLTRERSALIMAAASRALMLERHERAAELFVRMTLARRELAAHLDGRTEPPSTDQAINAEIFHGWLGFYSSKSYLIVPIFDTILQYNSYVSPFEINIDAGIKIAISGMHKRSQHVDRFKRGEGSRAPARECSICTECPAGTGEQSAHAVRTTPLYLGEGATTDPKLWFSSEPGLMLKNTSLVPTAILTS